MTVPETAGLDPFEAWWEQIPLNVQRAFVDGRGSRDHARFIFEWDRLQFDPSKRWLAWARAGYSMKAAANASANALKIPGVGYLWEVLKAEPPEIRWFYLQEKLLKALDKAANAILAPPPKVKEGETPVPPLDADAVVSLTAKLAGAFTRVAHELPHLAPEAHKMRQALKNARKIADQRPDPAPMSVAELERHRADVDREIAKLRQSALDNAQRAAEQPPSPDIRVLE